MSKTRRKRTTRRNRNGLPIWAQRGIVQLRENLQRILKTGVDEKVEIYAEKDPRLGFIVVEIAVVRMPFGGALQGHSWQRSNAHALGRLAAAENFVAACDVKPWRPEGWESDIDERLDALDALETLWEGG